MPAVTYVTSGSTSTGSTTITPNYPTGIRAGDILILAVSNKYPTNGPATPSGWTAPSGNQATGGAGTAGVDSGDVYATVFYKVADGTETGSVTVTISSGNSSAARILVYRPGVVGTFSTFDVECQSGSDTTAGTDWSVTTGSLDVETGDMVVAVSAVNGDLATWSTQSLAISGATFGTVTEQVDSPSPTNDDVRLVVSDHPVTAGGVDAAATYTMTGSTTSGNTPAGATVLVRIREVEDSQSAVLHQQEVAVLTVPDGAARLLLQEVSVIISSTASASVSATTVAATTTVGVALIEPAPGGTVAAATSMGAVTVSAGATVTVSTVAAVATVPTPTVDTSGNITADPATVAATATVGAVTVLAGSVVSAVTVAATTTVSGTPVTPAPVGTVAAVATVGAPTLSTDSTVTATTVAATTTIPTPSLDAVIVPVSTVDATTTIGTPSPPILSYVGTALDYAGTTTLTPTVPPGVAGDWLLLMVGVKGGIPAMISSGWQEVTGAAGASTNGTPIGGDVGDTTVRAFIKRTTTTTENAPSVSAGGSVVGIAKIFRFRARVGYNPFFTGVFIDDPTGGASYGGTSAGSVDVDAGSMFVAAGFVPTDVISWSAQSVAVSGATIAFTIEALDGATSSVLDLGTTMTLHTVTAGPGSGSVTYAATPSLATNAYGAIAVVAVSALPIVFSDTIHAATTIPTPIIREVQFQATATLGGLTANVTLGEDRVGWSAVITSPVDGSLVAAGGVTVAGYVYAADNGEAELQVEVSTSSTFASVLDSAISAPVDLDELATVSLAGLVAGTTYYLRARGGHSLTDEWGGWSPTVTITANAVVGDGYAYLYASDVDTSVPTPHIWWTIYDPETGTVTVVGTGFGDTAGTYNGELWVDYEPGGNVELTPTSWTTDSDTGNATTDDRTIVYGTSADPATTTVIADAPTDVDDRGLGTYIETDSGGVQTSDTVYSYPADTPATRTNAGWWVEVRDARDPDTIITTLHQFKSLSFSKPLNDAGTGELVMSKADPFFDIELPPPLGDEDEGKNILYFPLYFSFVQDGAERFRMVYDGKAKDRSQSDEPETVTLSGTGRAIELSWGVVLPGSWPADVKGFPRKRDDAVWAQLFVTLFDEAKDRGEIPETLRLGFTKTHDSYGVRWDQTMGGGEREVEIGTNLFDLIQTWGDAEEFDWMVTPRGRVVAAPVLGQDLSLDVRFFNAVTNQEVGATEDRKDLRTRVYVEGTNGHISYSEAEYPIARWGIRAMYLRSDQARSERQRIRVARGTLRQVRRPNRERIVKVPYEHLDPVTGESYGRTVFVDYGLGDIVGFGPRIDNETGIPRDSRDVRVREIGIAVDANGVDLELTMETRNERFEERVRRLLAARLGEWSAAKTAKQGKGSIHNARDTDVDDVVSGDTIVWDRDAELWKSGRPTDVWPFFYSGTLIPTVGKMYLSCDAKRTIRRITARLGDPSTSGPVTIALRRNNVVVHTMNVAAGNTKNRDIVDIKVTENDELSIDIVAAGTAAGYLQVVVEAG